MKFEIDTEQKTIRLLEPVSIGELYNQLDSLYSSIDVLNFKLVPHYEVEHVHVPVTDPYDMQPIQPYYTSDFYKVTCS